MYPVMDTSAPISFTTDTFSSKGVDPIDENTLPIQNFGVYGYWVPSSDDFGSAHKDNLYINNIKAVKGEDSIWRGETVCYWPVMQNVCFFAYAPYFKSDLAEAASPDAFNFQFPLETFSDEGMPRGTFTQSGNVVSQVDLCLGKPQVLNASIGAVPIQLEHALCNLKFYIRINGAQKEGTEYKVEELQINGLLASNSFSFRRNPAEGEMPFVWDTPAGDASYSASCQLTNYSSPSHISSGSYIKYSSGEATASNSTLINDQINGQLYLLPQMLTENANLIITLAMYKKNNASDTYSKISSIHPITVSLSGKEWKPGQTVSYYLTMGLSGGEYYIDTAITVRMEDWKNSVYVHEEETIE